MTLRIIISCDQCNLRRIKSLEYRRGIRDNTLTGRRLTDGRSWQEVDIDYIVRNGWQSNSDGQHICPACQAEMGNIEKTYDNVIYK